MCVRIHLPKLKIVWGEGNTMVLPTHPMIRMGFFLSTLQAQRIQPLTKLQTLNFFLFYQMKMSATLKIIINKLIY